MRLAVSGHDQEQEPALVRNGSMRQSRQAEASRGKGARRLRLLWVFALAALLFGCSSVETDQARLCRMALPALVAPDAVVQILSEAEDADRKGVVIGFRDHDGGPAHRAECRFRAPGRPNRSEDLIAIAVDGDPLDDIKRYFLIRFWLATPEARAADPSPLGDVAALPKLPFAAAYSLQQTFNGAAARGDLCAAGGRLFADLRADRTHQPRLRRAGCGGRLWRGVRRDGAGRRRSLADPAARPRPTPCSSPRPGVLPRAAGCFFRSPGRRGRSCWLRRSGCCCFWKNC